MATASSDTQSDAYYVHLARYSLAALFVLSFLWGVFQAAAPKNDRVSMGLSLLFAIAATLWARHDAMAHRKPILFVLQMLYLLLWPLAALVYLVVRYGWRGLLAYVGYTCALLGVMLLAFYGTLVRPRLDGFSRIL